MTTIPIDLWKSSGNEGLKSRVRQVEHTEAKS